MEHWGRDRHVFWAELDDRLRLTGIDIVEV